MDNLRAGWARSKDFATLFISFQSLSWAISTPKFLYWKLLFLYCLKLQISREFLLPNSPTTALVQEIQLRKGHEELQRVKPKGFSPLGRQSQQKKHFAAHVSSHVLVGGPSMATSATTSPPSSVAAGMPWKWRHNYRLYMGHLALGTEHPHKPWQGPGLRFQILQVCSM